MTSPYRESEGVRRAVRAHERQLTEHALREATRACIVVAGLGACFVLLAWMALSAASTEVSSTFAGREAVSRAGGGERQA